MALLGLSCVVNKGGTARLAKRSIVNTKPIEALYLKLLTKGCAGMLTVKVISRYFYNRAVKILP